MSMENLYIIYKHTSKTSKKSYIGKSYDWEYRWGQHIRKATKDSHNHFRNAIKKYGSEDFTCIILYICSDENYAYEMEEYFIAEYDTCHNGYNMNSGGRGASSGEMNHMFGRNEPLSEEHKQKISKATSGKNHYMYGKTHTEERKKNHSKCMSGSGHPFFGKKLSPEHCKKLTKAALNRPPMSDETKNKMSISSSGENSPMAKYYIAISPGGCIYTGIAIRQFAKDKKLPSSTLRRVARERHIVKKGPAKGWYFMYYQPT